MQITSSDIYQDYVLKGRNILASMRLHQLFIAHYATKVCTVRHGGRSNGYYTIKDYAHDLGINRKTLSGWVNVYRVVIAKLDMELDSVTPNDWVIASKVHEILKNEKRAINAAMGTEGAKDKGWKINAPKSKIKSLFQGYRTAVPAQAHVHSWTNMVIGIKGKLMKTDLSGVNVESLMMLKKQLDGASENLTNYLMDHRGVDLKELIDA